MAAKKLALETLLNENNLSLETALTTKQLAIVEQAYAVLGIAEVPQDIGKRTFVEYVQAWIRVNNGKKSNLS